MDAPIGALAGKDARAPRNRLSHSFANRYKIFIACFALALLAAPSFFEGKSSIGAARADAGSAGAGASAHAAGASRQSYIPSRRDRFGARDRRARWGVGRARLDLDVRGLSRRAGRRQDRGRRHGGKHDVGAPRQASRPHTPRGASTARSTKPLSRAPSPLGLTPKGTSCWPRCRATKWQPRTWPTSSLT